MESVRPRKKREVQKADTIAGFQGLDSLTGEGSAHSLPGSPRLLGPRRNLRQLKRVKSQAVVSPQLPFALLGLVTPEVPSPPLGDIKPAADTSPPPFSLSDQNITMDGNFSAGASRVPTRVVSPLQARRMQRQQSYGRMRASSEMISTANTIRDVHTALTPPSPQIHANSVLIPQNDGSPHPPTGWAVASPRQRQHQCLSAELYPRQSDGLNASSSNQVNTKRLSNQESQEQAQTLEECQKQLETQALLIEKLQSKVWCCRQLQNQQQHRLICGVAGEMA